MRLAVGVALGSCTNFFPTFGFGLPLALALAFITRTSIVGSIVGENLFKLIYPICLYMSFYVGALIYPLPHATLSFDSLIAICTNWDMFLPYARAMLAGGVVNFVVVGTALALLVYFLFIRYRYRIIHYLLHREEESI